MLWMERFSAPAPNRYTAIAVDQIMKNLAILGFQFLGCGWASLLRYFLT
jgi:hypothetical protein